MIRSNKLLIVFLGGCAMVLFGCVMSQPKEEKVIIAPQPIASENISSPHIPVPSYTVCYKYGHIIFDDRPDDVIKKQNPEEARKQAITNTCYSIPK